MVSAIAILEAEGFVAVFDGVEAMTKRSNVTIGGMVSLGGGLVAVTIRGELAHVIEAVEAGETTIRAGHGVVAQSVVFANPSPIVRALGEDPTLVG